MVCTAAADVAEARILGAKEDLAERAADEIAIVGAAFRESIDPGWGGRLRAGVRKVLGY